jgi:hypothetical protein
VPALAEERVLVPLLDSEVAVERSSALNRLGVEP